MPKTKPSKKAIRIFIGSLEMGGTERHLSQVLPKLVKMGWQVRISVLVRKGILAESLQKNGVQVDSLLSEPVRNIQKILPKVLGRLFRLTIVSLKLSLEFIKDRQTPIHFFLPESYILGMVCAKWVFFPGPKLMSRRSMNDYQNRRVGIRWLESKLHPKTTLVSGNSHAVVQQLIEEGIPNNKIRLIYNGIDLQPFNQTQDSSKVQLELGITEDSFVMVILANIIPYKGHWDLLQALSSIKTRLPSNWHLMCVGNDSGNLSQLKRVCVEAKMSNQVSWLGGRQDIPSLLSVAHVGILASHEEGFSNAILEYMAAGLPVIATDVGGNKEAVLHNQTGLIVPPKDPKILSEAILTLVNDKEKARAFGKAGYERVRREFSLERCVQSYDKLYQSLIEGKLPERSEDFTIPCVE